MSTPAHISADDEQAWLVAEKEAARVAQQAGEEASEAIYRAEEASGRFPVEGITLYEMTFQNVFQDYMKERMPLLYEVYRVGVPSTSSFREPMSRLSASLHVWTKLGARSTPNEKAYKLAYFLGDHLNVHPWVLGYALQRIPTSILRILRNLSPFSTLVRQGETISSRDAAHLATFQKALAQRESEHTRPALAQSGLIDHMRMRDTNAADYLAQWTSAGVTPQRPLANHSDWIRTPLASTREALARELEDLLRAVRSGVPAAQVRARLARARDSVPVEEEPAAKRAPRVTAGR